MKQLMKKSGQISTLFFAIILTLNAHAQAGLERSVPSNNAMLMQNLEGIELHFDSAVNLTKLELVNKADGQSIPIDFSPTTTPTADFSHPLPALKIGTYQVNWAAMGSDGHKMEGNFGFMMHVESQGGLTPDTASAHSKPNMTEMFGPDYKKGDIGHSTGYIQSINAEEVTIEHATVHGTGIEAKTTNFEVLDSADLSELAENDHVEFLVRKGSDSVYRLLAICNMGATGDKCL